MTTLEEKLATFSPESQARIAEMTRGLVEEELTMRDLRKARALTQEQVALAFNIRQANVSQLERRSDFLLSTLRSYVAAMGGELELVARFPGRGPVLLKSIGEIGETGPRPEDAGQTAAA